METRDAERLTTLTREVVELGLTLVLAPLKMLLRRLLPGATPIDQERWTPAGDERSVGDVRTSTPADVNGTVAAPPPPSAPLSPHAADLTSADAARLREAQREAESSADGPGPELRVEAPWPGYDAMNIAQVLERLTGADGTTRAMVRLYEETHKNRRGVLRATE
jgi:hypothetical protein